MESDGEHFLAYYLTKDDEAALEFKRRRLDPPSEPHEVTGSIIVGTVRLILAPQAVHFHFERDYELRKIEREVPNEFLLVLDEGVGEEDIYGDVTELPKRPKGAYYKNLERKMMLKRKRQNVRHFRGSTHVRSGLWLSRYTRRTRTSGRWCVLRISACLRKKRRSERRLRRR
jgi:RNA polymerase II-associated factor 1